MTQPLRPQAFTLIELLVVITIIVVLLALLTPALDKAVYQAQLAVCATREKGIATGVLMYAVDYKRMYPYRPLVSAGNGTKPNKIYVGNNPGSPGDIRPYLRNYISINGHLNDPLAPAQVDLDKALLTPQNIEASYHMWFGWRYRNPDPEQGMIKLGDRFTFTKDGRKHEFNFLVSDMDGLDIPNSDFVAGHQDHDSTMRAETYQNLTVTGLALDGTGVEQYTFTRWFANGFPRGPIDVNFTLDDGSVRRYNDVTWDAGDASKPNPRMIRAPMWPNGSNGTWEAHLGL